jgi:hypothetical protein
MYRKVKSCTRNPITALRGPRSAWAIRTSTLVGQREDRPKHGIDDELHI